ncbi:MAG: hypothetical protein HDR23_10615 [Lachnospiraceae bacterium]|nr:hypothetical protein [Lachnospiraceae bacterium]
MKRVMMVAVLGAVMIFLYLNAQSVAMYTKMPNNVLGLGEKKADVIIKNLSDLCTEFKTALNENMNRTYNSQFSLQETSDGYELILYDREEQEVYSIVYPKEPWVEEMAEGVLEIGISTGSPARYTFYFRKEDSKISDTFFNAKLFGGKYIAHRPFIGDQQNDPLILTDIFEEGILYQEIHRDFSASADLMSVIYSIELVDEDHVMLKYCAGEDYTILNEVVEIENTKSDRGEF